MKTELLAPAKDVFTAKCAIDCGADAVYIGASSFGARSKATNSLEDLKDLVDYAHKFYVKVYVTLNTILKDSELDSAQKLIKDLYDIGIDALIVQDMAIIQMAIDKTIPPIPLHISTQCNNRELEKVKFFDCLGVPRVVLARELSLEKIREIKANTNIELECFIHGALCVSYSGQCYLSNFIGGRSANRGECAQPCRKNYTLVNDKGEVLVKDAPLLSLKDFNATKYIKNLCDIGAASFKIEGRLKDVNYVKNTTLFYRKEIDKYSDKTSSGKVFTTIEPDLDKTFNRGYTDYFLDKRKKIRAEGKGEFVGKVAQIKKNGFVISGFQPNAQDGLFFENGESCLVNKFENGIIYPNKMPSIMVGQKVYRTKDVGFEKTLDNKIKRQIGINVSFEVDKLILEDEDNNKIIYSMPLGEKANDAQRMKETFIKQFSKTGESDFYIENININGELGFMPISQINEIRRECFALLMEERLKNYKREHQQEIKYTPYYKQEDDYHANVYNEKAKEFYKNCGCEIVQYAPEKEENSSIELMRTKYCIKYSLDRCQSPEKLYLIDDRGQKYQLKYDCKNCEQIIIKS